jgi:filamentous hemagglutinin
MARDAVVGVATFGVVKGVGAGINAVRTPVGSTPAASAPAGRISSLGGEGRQTPQLINGAGQSVRNAPTTISGRMYSGHALDQMQNRGLVPSVVENTIQQGKLFPTRAGTTGFYDPVNNLRVITNSNNGRVVTVIPGEP